MAHDYDTRPLFVSTLTSPYFPAVKNVGPAAPASTAWPAVNLAIIIPFKLPWDYPVARFFRCNGTSVAGTNWNIGVFNSTCAASLYVSGSTAGSGNTAPQYITPASTVWLPGDTDLFLALTHDSTAAAHVTGEALTAAKLSALGVCEATSAFALTAPLTLVTPANTFYPIAGFTRTASGF